VPEFEGVGELQHALTGAARAQQDLQQFGGAQRLRPEMQQSLARAIGAGQLAQA
jgi:hypothetical protein